MNPQDVALDAATRATHQRLDAEAAARVAEAIAAYDNEMAELAEFGQIASQAVADRLQLKRRVAEAEPWLRLRMSRGMAQPPVTPDLDTILGLYGGGA